MCRLPTSFLLNIQSCVKQEVDIPQIQNCVTRYSSPYWCSVPNIRKLASVVPEKNVTEIMLWANFSMSTIFKIESNRKTFLVKMPQIQKCVTRTVLHIDAVCQISGRWPLWFPRKMWQKLCCEQIYLWPQYSKSRQTGSGYATDSKLRYTIQFSILMICAKYQKAGLCGSQEKCDRNFLWRGRRCKTMDSEPYMSPPLKLAGNTIKSPFSLMYKKNEVWDNLNTSFFLC